MLCRFSPARTPTEVDPLSGRDLTGDFPPLGLSSSGKDTTIYNIFFSCYEHLKHISKIRLSKAQSQQFTSDTSHGLSWLAFLSLLRAEIRNHGVFKQITTQHGCQTLTKYQGQILFSTSTFLLHSQISVKFSLPLFSPIYISKAECQTSRPRVVFGSPKYLQLTWR